MSHLAAHWQFLTFFANILLIDYIKKLCEITKIFLKVYWTKFLKNCFQRKARELRNLTSTLFDSISYGFNKAAEIFSYKKLFL